MIFQLDHELTNNTPFERVADGSRRAQNGSPCGCSGRNEQNVGKALNGMLPRFHSCGKKIDCSGRPVSFRISTSRKSPADAKPVPLSGFSKAYINALVNEYGPRRGIFCLFVQAARVFTFPRQSQSFA